VVQSEAFYVVFYYSGRAMKNEKYAYYCCNINRENILTPNVLPCTDCIWLGVSTCYHQTISDENLMAQLSEEHADLVHHWPHLTQYPYKDSRIRCGREGLATFQSDSRHIEYDYA
jgi:hypothetical protein